MTPLRRRMTEDMTMRNFSPYTQRNYLFAVARFARHFDTSPADLGPEHSRAYLNHLIARKVSSSYFNINVAALRFLYTVTLERELGVDQADVPEEAAQTTDGAQQ